MDYEKIVDEELATGDPRSLEYRKGMIDVLRLKAEDASPLASYRAGTAEADAYTAGRSRGHVLWSKMTKAKPA